MFCFDEFAFTVQVKHKINSIQILGFILICLYFTVLRPGISTHVYFAKNVAYFPFNSWLSFQRLCRLLWGLRSRLRITVSKDDNAVDLNSILSRRQGCFLVTFPLLRKRFNVSSFELAAECLTVFGVNVIAEAGYA